jgi:hypothetical protein
MIAGLARILSDTDTTLVSRESRLHPGAREHDVGANREPERVIAHNRYIDEHADDGKDHQNERSHKPEIHCAYLLALRRNAQSLVELIATGNAGDPLASPTATSEMRGLTSIRPTRNACAP